MGSLRDLINAQSKTKQATPIETVVAARTEEKPREVASGTPPDLAGKPSTPLADGGDKAEPAKPTPKGLAGRLAKISGTANSGNGLGKPNGSVVVGNGVKPAPVVLVQPPPQPSQAIQRTQVAPSATPTTSAKIGETTLAQIQGNIKYLAENITEKELVGQVVRTIYMQLQQNPQFATLITDPEYDVITRGFMSAYHAAARKRVEGKEKKSAKQVFKSQNQDDLEKLFDEIEL